jgi:restriction system protein
MALLTGQLIDLVTRRRAKFFEKLVVKLLSTMGFGGQVGATAEAIGRAGDGGLDGVIDQDVLGLERVYIQAKRYARDNAVGPNAIRDFFGSLDIAKAAKGVFITTSSFTRQARETAEKLGKGIVLIDGEQLAALMIRYDVGVRIEETFHIEKVDEDFFLDD